MKIRHNRDLLSFGKIALLVRCIGPIKPTQTHLFSYTENILFFYIFYGDFKIRKKCILVGLVDHLYRVSFLLLSIPYLITIFQ